MAIQAVLLEPAITDIDGIVQWYERSAAEQVRRFFDELEHTLDALEQYPQSGSVGTHGLRHRHLRVFPHSVWYSYSEADSVITVLAILHDRRDEAVINNRIL